MDDCKCHLQILSPVWKLTLFLVYLKHEISYAKGLIFVSVRNGKTTFGLLSFIRNEASLIAIPMEQQLSRGEGKLCWSSLHEEHTQCSLLDWLQRPLSEPKII